MSDQVTRERSPLAIIALVVLFAALVVPVILSGREGTSEASDQVRYHYPVIQVMAAEWPAVDLVNYRSTTAPGYHLVLAVVARYATDNLVVLQLVASLASLALLLVVWRGADRFVGAKAAFVVTLPLAFSPYFLGSAIWLTTDNAALLFVALALAGASGVSATAARLARWGLYAMLAVAVRQIHLWVAGPVMWTALLALPIGAWAPRALRSDARLSWSSGLLVAPALLTPFILMGVFAWMWGGLTPPAYADMHNAGWNPAWLPFILALIGGHGVFFAPLFLRRVGDLVPRDPAALGAVGVGLVVALVFPTAYDFEAGRWGGPLWMVVERLPDIGQRSLVFPPLAALGALWLVRIWQRASEQGRGWSAGVLLLAILAWTSAQCIDSQVWQRYAEPFVLIALALSSCAAAGADRLSPARLLGPAALGVIQLAVAGWSLYLAAWRWTAPG